MSTKTANIQLRISPEDKRLLFQLAGSIALEAGGRMSMGAVLVELARREARHRGLALSPGETRVREITLDVDR